MFFLCRTGERVPLHCVDRHPNQQHIVATGSQDGMLSIWDVRQGSMPISLLNAHEAECKYLSKQDNYSNVVVTTRGTIFHHIDTPNSA